jgi:hypothetical protein
MPLRESLPWSSGLWRLVSSRPVRISLISAAILLLVTIACFRVQSLLFRRRVNSVLSRLAEVRLDYSTEREIQEIFPKLHPLKGEGVKQSDSTTQASGPIYWYEFTDSNVENALPLKLLWRLGKHVNSVLGLLYRLGHRYRTLSVSIGFREGKVVRIRYDLWLENRQNHMMFEGVGIDVTAVSRAGWARRDEMFAPTYNDLISYAGGVASNAPENVLHFAITPEAPVELRQAAYDVHLTCLWGLAKCQNTRQILPGVWPPRFPWKPWGSWRPRPTP